MKLRIRDNSIRLRLMQGEVARFASDGEVAARTAFPDGREFEYRLISDPNAGAVAAESGDAAITVRIPAAAAAAWCASDEIGIATELPLADGATLSILVEKDFACLKPRESEDESDMYPHPETD